MIKKFLFLCIMLVLVLVSVAPIAGAFTSAPNLFPIEVTTWAEFVAHANADGLWTNANILDETLLPTDTRYVYVWNYLYYKGGGAHEGLRSALAVSPNPLSFRRNTGDNVAISMGASSDVATHLLYNTKISSASQGDWTLGMASLNIDTWYQLAALTNNVTGYYIDLQAEVPVTTYAYLQNDGMDYYIPNKDITGENTGSTPYTMPSALYPPSWDLVTMVVDPTFPVRLMFNRTPSPTGTGWAKISSTYGGEDIIALSAYDLYNGKVLDNVLLQKHGNNAIFEVYFTSDHHYMPNYSVNYGRTKLSLAEAYTAPTGKITSPPSGLLTSSPAVTVSGYIHSANTPFSTWLEYRVNTGSPTVIPLSLTAVGMTFGASVPLAPITSSSIPIINYVELWVQESPNGTPRKLDTIQVTRSDGTPLYVPPNIETGEGATGLLSTDNLYTMGRNAISSIQTGLAFLGLMMQLTYSFLPLPIVLALSAICAFMLVPVLWKMWRG